MEQNFIALVAQYFIQINNAQNTMRQMLEAHEQLARGVETRDARIAELDKQNKDLAAKARALETLGAPITL